MGNNHSHVVTPKSSMSRDGSGEIPEKTQAQLQPSEKLAKLLATKSSEEDNVPSGISLRIFVKYVIKSYPDLGLKLFSYMVISSGGSSNSTVISPLAFSEQCERILSVLPEKQLVEMYVMMYGENSEINQDQLRDLLMAIYKIAMDHYPEGPQSCRYIFTTLQAVVESAFHRKQSLSVGYISHWLEEHCPRLITLLHRYVIHVLSTAHRSILMEAEEDKTGIELTTPVLEKCISFESRNHSQPLLPVSQVWLLAMSLPLLFTKPSQHSSPISFNKPIPSKLFLAKLLDFTCPSHWTLLYNSNQHGLGANRFVYHVTNYRGPTLTFLRGDQGVEFCIGVPVEWRESHQYWGSDDCIIMQMLPRYQVLLRGGKSMFLNLSIRGYPFGIRAGSDPRKPIIEVDLQFSTLTYCGIPYQLESVEVWGCGTPQSRDAQLDLRKWESKQIEKVRTVKLSANDWSDHPDRYLLELAGRPSYTTS